MEGPSRRQLLFAGASVPLLSSLRWMRPAAALDGVDVLSRAVWGGDLRPTGPLSEEAPGDVRFLLVHHTASSNAYASGDVVGALRGIYRYHTTHKGWPDIAYNFLVDRFGRVWEGRTGSLDAPVKGDATGGSQGFALLACFLGDHSSQAPTAAAIDAMGRLLKALASRYGINVAPGATTTFTSRGSNRYPAGTVVTTSTIAGHRDMSLTTCPGNAAYRLVPTLVPWPGKNPVDVFRRGRDNALWHKLWNGSWSGWESLGGVLTSEPAAASWDDTRTDVFVRGSDNALWHKWWGGSWSGWASLGGILTSGPGAAWWSSDRIDVFVRGLDNGLWCRSWNGSWGPWRSLGGRFASAPAVVSWGPGRIDVFVRGIDDALWHRHWAGSWSGWASLGGVLTADPTVSSWGPDRLDVFVRGSDGALWQQWWDGRWSGWVRQGPLP